MTEKQYNPFTGEKRDPRDVQSDPLGKLIHDGGPLMAAPKPLPTADEELEILKYIVPRFKSGDVNFRNRIIQYLESLSFDLEIQKRNRGR